MKIRDNIEYVGVTDNQIDLFEGQYHVPNGVSYNSYVIIDEKIAIMDSVDAIASENWLNNIKIVLKGRKPDYLIVSHLEPDHGGSIECLIKEYPDITLIGNVKTKGMLPLFFDTDYSEKMEVVKENDTLNLGAHELVFMMAPMVHWPEVMVSYEKNSKVLFSADGFGKFGTLDTDENWDDEARRYYLNIVGKYGVQVQNLLKKASTLDIEVIAPLHGPVLKENLNHYLGLYDKWSRYESESNGVLIACASIHKNTYEACLKLKEELEILGCKDICLIDLARFDEAEALSKAFYYKKMVLACSTYDGGLFPPMESFLNHLKAKTYRNRIIGLMENGSWAPMANKKMIESLSLMKDLDICEHNVTLKGKMKDANLMDIKELAAEILNK